MSSGLRFPSRYRSEAESQREVRALLRCMMGVCQAAQLPTFKPHSAHNAALMSAGLLNMHHMMTSCERCLCRQFVSEGDRGESVGRLINKTTIQTIRRLWGGISVTNEAASNDSFLFE